MNQPPGDVSSQRSSTYCCHLASSIHRCKHRRRNIYAENGQAMVIAVDDYINKHLRTDPLSPQGKVVTLDDAYTLDLRPDILSKSNQGRHYCIATHVELTRLSTAESSSRKLPSTSITTTGTEIEKMCQTWRFHQSCAWSY